MTVYLTVYYDAVKTETDAPLGKRKMIGWFKDEVCAVAAVLERTLMCSHILAEDRKLPEITIRSEYKPEWCKRPLVEFRRAIRVKYGPDGRKIVRVPGTFNKPWIQNTVWGGV